MSRHYTVLGLSIFLSVGIFSGAYADDLSFEQMVKGLQKNQIIVEPSGIPTPPSSNVPSSSPQPTPVIAPSGAPSTQPAPVASNGKLDLEIGFDYNSDKLTPQGMRQLAVLARALNSPELNSAIFAIVGHTDAKGSDESNLRLSMLRANAVKDFLTATFDIPARRLAATGVGRTQPKNVTDPYAAENRRVEIVNLTATP